MTPLDTFVATFTDAGFGVLIESSAQGLQRVTVPAIDVTFVFGASGRLLALTRGNVTKP